MFVPLQVINSWSDDAATNNQVHYFGTLQFQKNVQNKGFCQAVGQTRLQCLIFLEALQPNDNAVFTFSGAYNYASMWFI
jgi:hypothetical protein